MISYDSQVRNNEAITHPVRLEEEARSREKPLNVSIHKIPTSEGQHLSAISFSDTHFEKVQGNF